MKISCCSAILWPGAAAWAILKSPARNASERPGRRTPRGRSGSERNMRPGREAKVRGSGPESGGGSLGKRSGKVQTSGFGRGVTGNRSVGGRWRHRTLAGPKPSGGKVQEGASAVRVHAQTPGAFAFLGHRFPPQASRNARTAASNSRGFSAWSQCPAPGILAKRAFGNSSLIRSRCSRFT